MAESTARPRHLVLSPLVELKSDRAAASDVRADFPGTGRSRRSIGPAEHELADPLHRDFQAGLGRLDAQPAGPHGLHIANNLVAVDQQSEVTLQGRIGRAVALQPAIPL